MKIINYLKKISLRSRSKMKRTNLKNIEIENRVFICALPRSGTTLLRLILDSHSKIASPPETLIFHYFIDSSNDSRVVEALSYFGYAKKEVNRYIGTCISLLLDDYTVSKNKSIWVEKTPSYVPKMQDFVRCVKDSKVIILIRDPLYIVNSMYERDMLSNSLFTKWYDSEYDSTINGYIQFVIDMFEKIFEFKSNTSQRKYHSVNYEDLTDNPVKEIKSICVFLGIDYEHGMLEYHKIKHDSGLGDTKISAKKGVENKKAKLLLSEQQIVTVTGELYQIRKKLGYIE